MVKSYNQTMKLIPVFLIIFLFSISLVLAYVAWTTILTTQLDKYSSKSNDLKMSTNTNQPNGEEMSGEAVESGSKTGSGSGSGGGNLGVLQNLIPFFRRGSGSENGISNLETVDEKALLGPDLFKNVEKVKMKVISNLRRYLLNGAKVTGHVNAYGVDFTRFKQKFLKKPNVHEMMCRIKNLNIDILNENTSPVFHSKTFPQVSLFDESNGISMEKSFQSQKQRQASLPSDYYTASSSAGFSTVNVNTATTTTSRTKVRNLDVPIYRSCAVVPNSAALDGSQHGIDIDSHDFILRFNKAPTVGFEDDVGTLTSMRIVNSQVVTKPEFLFPHSSYYTDRQDEIQASGSQKTMKQIAALDSLWLNTRKFLMWDPCNYTGTVEQWYTAPEFSLFGKYFNLTSQDNLNYGRNRFYILNCRSIWKMWELLQEYSIARIYGTPPTSGFIGIILALQVCERVDVYEYIPSVRESVRCNYYGPKNDSNPSCTYGSWHPVSAEKLFALELSDSTDKQIFMDGYLSIPGVSAYKCNN